MEYATLGNTDYIIFCLMLVVSSGIGVYFRFSGGKQKTTEEYLLAGKNMGIFPVAFSLMASFKSAISFIGLPAEMYTYGTHFAFYSVGHIIGTFLSAYIFLPVFFDMQVSTAYEYLEKRFGKTARSLCSFSFTIQMVLYMSVVLYAPALALSAVTNLSIWVSVISIGVVCTFYSTIGGMKAVLWTDVFQGFLMYISLFSVIFKGCIDVGGVTIVFSRTQTAGRLVVPSFKPDLTLRYTMWNVCLQGLLLNLATFGTSQIQVQRLLTLRSLKRSQIAMLVSLPMAVTFHLGSCFAGLVIFANFFDCDPLTSGEGIISKMDQLLPYFVMISLGTIPGLPGLCICGIFSASLSTVSSAVNSLTAVTMEDFIRPFCGSCGMIQAKAAFSAKAITLFYGILCMLLAFVIAQFGGVMQASVTVFGMMAGPVLGTFFLGMFTIRTNEKGAVTGMLLSLALAAWMSFGSSVAGVTHPKLPFLTEGCDFSNVTEPDNPLVSLNGTNFTLPLSTLLTTTVQPVSVDTQNSIFPLYQVSFMWLTTVGFLGSIIVGYVTSFFIGERPKVQREYLSPCVRCLFSETRRKQPPIQMEKVGDIKRKSDLSHSNVAFSSEFPKEEATVTAVSYNNMKVSKF